jgi:hypothetical protein
MKKSVIAAAAAFACVYANAAHAQTATLNAQTNVRDGRSLFAQGQFDNEAACKGAALKLGTSKKPKEEDVYFCMLSNGAVHQGTPQYTGEFLPVNRTFKGFEWRILP